MTDNTFQIEIDGKQVEAFAGEMLIATADRAGIYIPRFCYHKKLKIAANCRMCLVEVANAPKTLPACATPVAPGMQAFTRSKKTIESQKAVMEFLLANHPLDCPICDQGGECELQDLAMGYGSDKSRFSQEKRAVSDEDLGPLVATEMTRCIHCTRCVRFCEEIGGTQQLGAMGRGGDMNIGTFLVNGLNSELSANVIDLCPVGALTSKPFRYKGRSWEFKQHISVSPHDCVGTNMYYHSFPDNYGNKAEVMRALPRDNESVNENWMSDRDRFSYTAFASEERLTQPMLKRNGIWHQVDWESALNYLVDNLKSIMSSDNSSSIGGLISANSSCEELYLFQKFIRALGSNNVDHRTHVNCFSDQSNFTSYPGLTKPLAEINNAKSILLVGSFAREEQPLLFHRIRQAVNNGSKLYIINSYDYDFACEIEGKVIVSPADYVSNIVALCANFDNKLDTGNIPATQLKNPNIKAIASQLKLDAGSVAIFAGEQIESLSDASNIRSWLYKLSKDVNASFNHITKGANATGAWLSGAIPHRSEFMLPATKGLNAHEMLAEKLAVYFLHGLDLDHDFADPQLAEEAFKDADIVVTLTPFVSEKIQEHSDLILPIAAFSEYAGSFINVEGHLQRFDTAVMPLNEAKPGWKIYKAIANLLGFENFDFDHCSDITKILKDSILSIKNDHFWEVSPPNIESEVSLMRIGHWPANRVDALVRRSKPLQQVNYGNNDAARINSTLANELGIENGQQVVLSQNGTNESFTCNIDDNVANGCIWLTTANAERSNLGNVAGVINFVKVVN